MLRKRGGEVEAWAKDEKKLEKLVLFPEVYTNAVKMTDEQFGTLMRAVFAYRFEGAMYGGDDLAVDVMFRTIAGQIDRYEEVCQINANNRGNGNTEEADAKKGNTTEVNEKEGKHTPNPIPYPYKDICSSAICLLNDLSGSSFKVASKATQRLITARAKEGYNLDDFALVIRHQCSLWAKDEKMRRYLRPETLFGNKFEAYLSDAKRIEPKQEQYSFAPLEDPWEAAMREAERHA